MRWAVVASALLTAGPALEASLARSHAALSRGEFNRALAILDAIDTRGAPGPDVARVHLLRAECFAALRQDAKVETALREALLNDPDARLDPNEANPDLVAKLERTRASLPPPRQQHQEPGPPIEPVVVETQPSPSIAKRASAGLLLGGAIYAGWIGGASLRTSIRASSEQAAATPDARGFYGPSIRQGNELGALGVASALVLATAAGYLWWSSTPKTEPAALESP